MAYMIRIGDITPDRATITAVDVEPQALCWETGHVSGFSSYELDSDDRPAVGDRIWLGQVSRVWQDTQSGKLYRSAV